MKIDPHSVPLLATLSLFVYLIWPHLFMDARPSVVTGAAVSTKVPGDVDLVKTHTGPRRDPFLKSFNDSYPDMPKAHEVHDKQMSKITGGGRSLPGSGESFGASAARRDGCVGRLLLCLHRRSIVRDRRYLGRRREQYFSS